MKTIVTKKNRAKTSGIYGNSNGYQYPRIKKS